MTTEWGRSCLSHQTKEKLESHTLFFHAKLGVPSPTISWQSRCLKNAISTVLCNKMFSFLKHNNTVNITVNNKRWTLSLFEKVIRMFCRGWRIVCPLTFFPPQLHICPVCIFDHLCTLSKYVELMSFISTISLK